MLFFCVSLAIVEELFHLRLYSQRDRSLYSLQWLPDNLASQVAHLEPDVINLHWINAGYLQIETLAKMNKPLVWTLHDMWAFTEGCHYCCIDKTFS
jgi:hypothetical protein